MSCKVVLIQVFNITSIRTLEIWVRPNSSLQNRLVKGRVPLLINSFQALSLFNVNFNFSQYTLSRPTLLGWMRGKYGKWTASIDSDTISVLSLTHPYKIGF